MVLSAIQFNFSSCVCVVHEFRRRLNSQLRTILAVYRIQSNHALHLHFLASHGQFVTAKRFSLVHSNR